MRLTKSVREEIIKGVLIDKFHTRINKYYREVKNLVKSRVKKAYENVDIATLSKYKGMFVRFSNRVDAFSQATYVYKKNKFIELNLLDLFQKEYDFDLGEDYPAVATHGHVRLCSILNSTEYTEFIQELESRSVDFFKLLGEIEVERNALVSVLYSCTSSKQLEATIPGISRYIPCYTAKALTVVSQETLDRVNLLLTKEG